MADYCENILRTITMVTNDAISKANFDKTILATIVQCEDQATGKYKVKYQDSIWTAYDSNMAVTYSEGTNVYVLIPGGNFNNQKTIVGATSNFGIDYLDYVNNETKFLQNGNSITTLSNEQGICSYEGSDQIVLYDVEIDDAAAAEYLQSSEYIMLKADFRTNLADSQRNQGSYGLKVDIVFQNTQNQEEDITRTYVLDIDDMVGNPYLFTVPLSQEEVYELDGKHFKYISSISFYCENFNTGSPRTNDIFISNVELYGMNALTTQELQGASLRFKRLQGYIFNSTSGNSDEDTRDVIAQLRIKGRYMTPAGNKISFYWFKQDSHIDSASRYYSKYGGKGWKCLNDIQEDQETGDIKILAAGDTLTIKRSDVIIKRVRYKCVAVYNGTEISNTFEMINLHSQYEIEIISDDPKKELTFYSNEDSLLLKCVVKYNGSVITQNLNYYWRKVSEHGTSENLSPYIDDQQPPVTHNDMTMAQAFQVVSYSDYYCSVYKTITGGQQEIGTASVRIFRKTENTSRYILTINNGTQLFNYDEAGNSPFIQGLNETHQTIPALTFTVIDTYTEQDVTELVDEYIWSIPLKNTLLVDGNTDIGVAAIIPTEDQDPDYRQYKNYTPFIYGIRERYYSDKTNNDITLKVSIHNIQMNAKTDLLFTKEGQSGTNGTGIVCKIKASIGDERVSGWLCVRIDRSSESGGNLTVSKNWNSLSAELWQNGSIIDTTGQTVSVTWEMLSLGDNSWYTIDQNGVVNLASSSSKPKSSDFISFDSDDGFPANLVKVTVQYNDRKYYDIVPIVTLYTIGRSNLQMNVLNGFKYVTYSQDGENPKYDDTLPFTVSLSQDLLTQTSFTVWKAVGSIKDYKTGSTEEGNYRSHYRVIDYINLKENTTKEIESDGQIEDYRYKKFFDVTTLYNGGCVTNAIVVYRQGRGIYIHIPIHFMLNKYGHRNLNDWDGNSIKIDTKDNYILSPQIGAGKKEGSSNAFTGILMGIIDNKQNSQFQEQTGLFGYHQGQRTIFLDADTGKAEFGVAGKGQIRISPVQTSAGYEAIIQGGQYQQNTASAGQQNNGQGMRINLTTPEIKYGTGYFHVDSNGLLTSKRGNIASWYIQDNCLYHYTTTVSNPHLGTSSSNKNYLYLGTQGLSFGKDFIYNAETGALTVNVSTFALGGKPIDKIAVNWTTDQTPTLQNYPYTSWTDDKANHNDEICYDISSGKTYRFVKTVKGIKIKFSQESQTENSWDFVYIYYKKNGSLYRTNKITGSSISNAEIIIPSADFYVYWKSDSSNYYWGYKIESVTACADSDTFTSVSTISSGNLPVSENETIILPNETYPQSDHPYSNYEEMQYYCQSGYNISSSGTSEQGWQQIQDVDIRAAAQTATNYMIFDSTYGLRIYQSTASMSGARNIQIVGDNINIRKGDQTLVSYGDNINFYNHGSINFYHRTREGTTDIDIRAAYIDVYGMHFEKGSITLGTNFSVTSDGVLTAKQGTIGGIHISTTVESLNPSHVFANSLYTHTSDGSWSNQYVYQAGISAESSSPTNLIFYVKRKRNMDTWDVNNEDIFYVRKNGQLKAINAHIEGEITANSGSIANFIICNGDNKRSYSSANGGHYFNTSLYSHITVTEDATIYDYQVGIRGDASSTGAAAFYIMRTLHDQAWTNAQFVLKIQNSGKVVMKKAQITGNIIGDLNIGSSTVHDIRCKLEGNSGTGYFMTVNTGSLYAGSVNFGGTDFTGQAGLSVTSSAILLKAIGVGAGTALVVNNNNVGILSEGSSKRYKNILRNMTEEDINIYYKIQPKIAKYKSGYLPKQDRLSETYMPMLIAQDCEQVSKTSVYYNTDGQVENYRDRQLIVVHQQMLISQHNKILQLQQELNKIKKEIKKYENKI